MAKRRKGRAPHSADSAAEASRVLACALLTGARVSALITLKLKHVRADRLGIKQDAREVHTKFSKTQTTFFFPVGKDLKAVFLEYVDHLSAMLHWGVNDPLFPATRNACGPDLLFHFDGLTRQHWRTPDAVRKICKRAYAAAGLPYFTPHSFRNCLMNIGQRICHTGEELKAFSQNLGHDDLHTSMTSYGAMSKATQCQIVQSLACGKEDKLAQLRALLNDPDLQKFSRGDH